MLRPDAAGAAHATQEVNGQLHTLPELASDPAMPLLCAARRLNLTGTKYGCGVAACGACTVHVDGEPRRRQRDAAGSVLGHAVRTIEGLGHAEPHLLQLAWLAEQVPQCGYCQSGYADGRRCAAGAQRPPQRRRHRRRHHQPLPLWHHPRVRTAIKRAARLWPRDVGKKLKRRTLLSGLGAARR